LAAGLVAAALPAWARAQNPNEATLPQLRPEEQRFVDELLTAWQRHSGGIKTFECEFTRWFYDPNFGPRDGMDQLLATTVAYGNLTYVKPDKGVFHVKRVLLYEAAAKEYRAIKEDPNEHWVCDGKHIWEFDGNQKQLRGYPLPPEMQGKQIGQGPLPFMLFGAEAESLKQRYLLRERTDPRYVEKEIWLDVFPLWQADASNFRSCQLILSRDRFLPHALRTYLPDGKTYHVIQFDKVRINNPGAGVSEPRAPLGWQKVVEPPQVGRLPAEGSRR
jgi:TIGR03009 family protein